LVFDKGSPICGRCNLLAVWLALVAAVSYLLCELLECGAALSRRLRELHICYAGIGGGCCICSFFPCWRSRSVFIISSRPDLQISFNSWDYRFAIPHCYPYNSVLKIFVQSVYKMRKNANILRLKCLKLLEFA
jgi:hypothetical protein